MALSIIRQTTTAWLLTVGAALLPLHCVAAERLYHFVDENGVSHFSNVPVDERYQPMVPGDTSAPPAAADARRPGAATAAPPPGMPLDTEPPVEIDEMPLPGAVEDEDESENLEPDSDDS
jgi:hypothetical protein